LWKVTQKSVLILSLTTWAAPNGLSPLWCLTYGCGRNPLFLVCFFRLKEVETLLHMKQQSMHCYPVLRFLLFREIFQPLWLQLVRKMPLLCLFLFVFEIYIEGYQKKSTQSSKITTCHPTFVYTHPTSHTNTLNHYHFVLKQIKKLKTINTPITKFQLILTKK